jgi:hypothetical protein
VVLDVTGTRAACAPRHRTWSRQLELALVRPTPPAGLCRRDHQSDRFWPLARQSASLANRHQPGLNSGSQWWRRISLRQYSEGEPLHPTRQRDRDPVRREIFGYGSLTLLFGPKDFDTWGRSEDLAEVVHPVPSVFG